MTATTSAGGPVLNREFEDFFEQHHDELARLAYLLVGEHGAADDLTGDTLLAAAPRWPRLRRLEEPFAGVRRLMGRAAAARLRRLVRQQDEVRSLRAGPGAGDLAEPGTDPLLALSTPGRICVTLRYALGLSEREVARILWLRVATVRIRTTEGLAQLVAVAGVPAHHTGAAAGSRRASGGRPARLGAHPAAASAEDGG